MKDRQQGVDLSGSGGMGVRSPLKELEISNVRPGACSNLLNDANKAIAKCVHCTVYGMQRVLTVNEA